MNSIRTKIAEDGSIVIPEEYRQVLGIRAGDEVILFLEDEDLHVFTLDGAIKYAQELLRPYLPEGRSLSDELVAERHLEASKE